MLIDTELHRAKGMVPLRRLTEKLEELPVTQLEKIGERLRAAQEAEDPTFVNLVQSPLNEGRVYGDLHVQVILAALAIGELTAYVLRPHTNSAYKLSTGMWRVVGAFHDTARSIEKGLLALRGYPTDEIAPRWEIENRPLLMKKSDFDQFLRLRLPSEAQLRRAAQDIVSRFQRDYPDQRNKKDNFVEQMKTMAPGCTRQWAFRMWEEYAPSAWKMPGRPSEREPRVE